MLGSAPRRWVVIACLALGSCDAESADPDGGGSPEDAGSMAMDGAVEADAEAPDVDAGVEPPCLELDVPFGTGAPVASAIDHPLAPDAFAEDLGGPFPTNAWWQPLVVGRGDLVVNGFPYLLQTTDAGLSVSAPRVREDSFAVRADFVPDWRLSSAEALSGREVADYDALSVTVRWSSSAGDVEAPLVRGMPYATLRHAGSTPLLTTIHDIVGVDGGNPETVTGDRFEVELANGQRWRVYTSEPTTFRLGPRSLRGTAPFTGFVRVAFLPEGGDAGVLDASAGVVPVGGAVRLVGCGTRGEGEIDFTFEAEGEGDLLVMGLPHHAALLGDDEARPAFTVRTVRGEMFGVLGETWTMALPLDPGGFDAPRPIAPERRAAVQAALEADRGFSNVSPGPYFGGKELAAMGRLAVIADALNDDAIAGEVRQRLAVQLAPWLAGTMPRFEYDRTWGGIVADGAVDSPTAFFGQGYYNDHHFHYGYHLYAAAALGRGDPAWLAANLDNVDALARDIANPSPEDAFFTPFRSFDFYTGHSWAAGIVDFGRNQESTSEAVNAWYALALWGEVTGRPAMRRLGQLLTALEVRAAQAYWQIEPGSPVYGDGEFADNRVVGILFDTRAEYNTFFGRNIEYIHGIQYLPFTPVTERLLDPVWMREAYPVVSQALTRPDPPIHPGWEGFLYMAHATFEPGLAWDEVQGLTGYDNGNTATNTLWWVATRP
jgi:endo-1,3(4)-beta-glucanase